MLFNPACAVDAVLTAAILCSLELVASAGIGSKTADADSDALFLDREILAVESIELNSAASTNATRIEHITTDPSWRSLIDSKTKR